MADFYLETNPDALLTPTRAIVIYENGFNHPAFASVHPIYEGQIGEGHALDPFTLQEALLALTGRQANLRWVHPHLLAEAPDLLAWWVPAEKRRLYFKPSFDGPVAEKLKSLSGQLFPQPPLVFIRTIKGLTVYALPQNERPAPNTPLLLPPYYNTQTGQVCLGTTPLEANLDPGKLDAYTNAFFASAFTHPWGRGTRFEADHADMWSRAKRLGRFAKKWLMPAKKTLNEAIEEARR